MGESGSAEVGGHAGDCESGGDEGRFDLHHGFVLSGWGGEEGVCEDVAAGGGGSRGGCGVGLTPVFSE